MTSLTSTTQKTTKSRWARIARAIGLRMLVWGGVVGLVVMFFGDVRFLIRPGTYSSVRATDSGKGASQSPDRNKMEQSRELPAGPGWPHLRGPNYDGCSGENNLADSWPEEGPPLLSMRELGAGYSGFGSR